MKKIFTLTLTLILISRIFGQAYISDRLFEKIQNNDSEMLYVTVYLADCLNVDSLMTTFKSDKIDINRRPKIVLEKITEVTLRSQPQVISSIMEICKDNRYLYSDLQSYKIINAISLNANANLIFRLAERSDILLLELNYPILKIESPVTVKNGQSKSIGGTEPGLIAIKADLMWALGYTGRNRIGMNIDTGINFEHPAISGNFLGNYLPLSQCWFPFNNPTPLDISDHSHGTHTIGTMMGLDVVNHDTIGVAFNASWISSDPIVSDLNYLRTLPEIMTVFEWALNPDGDTATVWDIPDVINNSWGWVDPPDTTQCNTPITDILNVCEAAGIAVVFSAGNDGDLGPGSVGEPAHKAVSLVNAFAVGSVNGNVPSFPISDFSSLGPTLCADSGALQIKPEVVAPGENVRSAMGIDEYGLLSGTSMAGPHVAGAILLLKEAFPFLSGEELKLALYYSAVDLGVPGEDNTYGRGIIDVFAAFNYLSQIYTPEIPIASSFDIEITGINNPDFDFNCDSLLEPSIVVKNIGTQPVFSFNAEFNLNGLISFDTLISMTLQPSDILNIQFPQVYGHAGYNSIIYNISLDSALIEYNRFNNYKTAEFKIAEEYQVPFFEDFENINKLMTNTSWFFRNPDKNRTWTIDTTGVEGGTNKAIFLDFYYYEPDDGQIDELISPLIVVPDTGGLQLIYSVAYRQRRSWTNDSLKIYISTDCGLTFPYLMYANGGDSLETYHHNLGYPRFIPDQPEHWRSDTIDLSQFVGSDRIMIRFDGRNNKGNSLWLDDIQVISVPGTDGIQDLKLSSYKIFPNPVNDLLFIQNLNNEYADYAINLMDINGRHVMNTTESGKLTELDVSSLNCGVYFLTIKDKKNIQYYRFVKQ